MRLLKLLKYCWFRLNLSYDIHVNRQSSNQRFNIWEAKRDAENEEYRIALEALEANIELYVKRHAI